MFPVLENNVTVSLSWWRGRAGSEPQHPVVLRGRRISGPPWHPPSGTFQIKQECLACRGAAAVFDMSYFGKFYLVGVDARKAADWLFSADVSRPPGMRPGWAVVLSCFSTRKSSVGTAPGAQTRWHADPVPSGLPQHVALPLGLALGPSGRPWAPRSRCLCPYRQTPGPRTVQPPSPFFFPPFLPLTLFREASEAADP